MGKRKKKKRKPPQKSKKGKTVAELEAEKKDKEIKSVPRCLIFERSKKTIGTKMKYLLEDLRLVMLPYTSKHVVVQKKTRLSQLEEIAGQIHVTHFILLGLTNQAPKLKVVRLPRGPTLFFDIEEYSLMSDVRKFFQKLSLRYDTEKSKYQKPAVVLFNNFDINIPWINLTKVSLENMFPTVDVEKFDPWSDATRLVMFHMDKTTMRIDMRHYRVDVKDTKVQLGELGPRLRLRLVKICEKVMEGEVLYHSHVQRTRSEVQKQREMHVAKRREKERRKREQEENVERKMEKKREKILKKKNRLKMLKRRREEDRESVIEEVANEAMDYPKKRRKLEGGKEAEDELENEE